MAKIHISDALRPRAVPSASQITPSWDAEPGPTGAGLRKQLNLPLGTLSAGETADLCFCRQGFKRASETDFISCRLRATSLGDH